MPWHSCILMATDIYFIGAFKYYLLLFDSSSLHRQSWRMLLENMMADTSLGQRFARPAKAVKKQFPKIYYQMERLCFISAELKPLTVGKSKLEVTCVNNEYALLYDMITFLPLITGREKWA